jgi:hypothetical protein
VDRAKESIISWVNAITFNSNLKCGFLLDLIDVTSVSPFFHTSLYEILILNKINLVIYLLTLSHNKEANVSDKNAKIITNNKITGNSLRFVFYASCKLRKYFIMMSSLITVL